MQWINSSWNTVAIIKVWAIERVVDIVLYVEFNYFLSSLHLFTVWLLPSGHLAYCVQIRVGGIFGINLYKYKKVLKTAKLDILLFSEKDLHKPHKPWKADSQPSWYPQSFSQDKDTSVQYVNLQYKTGFRSAKFLPSSNILLFFL